MADSTDKHCDALLVCASINIVFVFGMNGWIHPDESSSAWIARFLGIEWIPMVRGVNAVLFPMYERIRSGPLAPLLDLSVFEAVILEQDTTAEDQIISMVRTTWATTSDSETYDKAHSLLRTCFAYMNKCEGLDDTTSTGCYNRANSGPLIWVFLAPDNYFTLLSQRQPPALILFAYLGVLFHRLDDLWFLRGWGRGIVEAVDNVLGPWWQEWLSWPKVQTRAKGYDVSP